MADIYVRSTDGSNSDNGSTWALAKATAAGAAAIDAAGDRILFSQSHSESTASAVTIALAGTTASPVQMLCVNDAAEPPTALATGATIKTTGASNLTITGVGYVYGLTLEAGEGAGVTVQGFLAGADNSFVTYENCKLRMLANSSAGRWYAGSESSGNESCVRLKDTTVRFANNGAGIIVAHCSLIWEGGGLEAGGTAPNNLFHMTTDGGNVEATGLDLSAAGTGLNLFSVSGTTACKGVVRNCKLPSGWSGAPSAAIGNPNARLEMWDCNAGDVHYALYILTYAGSIRDERTVVPTGDSISHKFVSTANAVFPAGRLVGPEVFIPNDATGASITIEAEVLTDNVTLTDAECFIEVFAKSVSGFPTAVLASDAKADVLASAANQTTSSAGWTTTGITMPVKQKLSVSVTPQEAGPLYARVVVTKASTTVYSGIPRKV